MTPTNPHNKYNPDPDLPKTAEYRRGRRKNPSSTLAPSQMRSLLCLADRMYDELIIRIAVLEGTISDLGLMRPGDPAPRACDPTPSSTWLKEDFDSGESS